VKVGCSLCGQILEKDDDWPSRKKAHENYHKFWRGRNNITGVPKWIARWE